jgi:Fe-S-cluster-containing hydrogenase component 2
MGTGPHAARGYDIALTEVTGKRHHFVAESGSKRGTQVLGEIPRRDATAAEEEEAIRRVHRARTQITRQLDTEGLRDALLNNPEHPRWEEVARRCLTCANCTLVCPTCFCSTIEDTTDLSGNAAGRVRRWDSCFTLDFSYIHGGCIRSSAKSRYRQWLTHKLAGWHDQFGSSGCVGCGRCITWCPVGIDITEEARAIRSGPRAEHTHHS